MKRKQLQLLFACNLVIFLSGSGIMAVLPIYATELGASGAMIGYYMAFLSLMFAAGNMVTSWLTRLLPRKVLYVTAGFAGSLALAAHIYVSTLWQAFLLTGLVWLFGGIGLALSNVFTARLADKDQRGAIFGLIALSHPLASLLGGLLVGPLIALQGYTAMFIILAHLWFLWPVSALLWLTTPKMALTTDQPTSEFSNKGLAKESPEPTRPRVTPMLLLTMAAFVASMAVSSIRLAVPLSMQALHFSTSAIVSITTVCGLVTIPLALFYGNLSDKLGKKEILGWRYLLLIASALLGLVAADLWHFWAMSVLVFATGAIGGSVARAFATDILPSQRLESGLTRFESISSLAGMAGSISAGYLIDVLGPSSVYSFSAVLAVVALLVLDKISPPVEDKMTVFLRIEQLIIARLVQDFTQRRTRRATNSAYAQFSRHNPRWANSLFDERFLREQAQPLLENHIAGVSPANGTLLAQAWTEQNNYRDEAQRQGHVTRVAPIAAEFLRLFDAERSANQIFGNLTGRPI